MCAQSVNHLVHINDDNIGPIVPSRGLRQGDLLSHPTFLLFVHKGSRV